MDPVSCGNYIIGGSVAKDGDFPYQASLYLDSFFMCGGSIINEKYILTAAHCTKGYPANRYNVGVGSVHLSEQRKHAVEKNIVHPKYNARYIENDIALLALRDSIAFNQFTRAIKLPEDKEPVSDSMMMTATGWGATSSKGADVLRHVNVPIVNHKKCMQIYGHIEEYNICAGYVGIGGKDTCQGDSGGPLVANKTLYGITSWGIGCAHPKYPGVYTGVSHFRKWIREQTEI